jgi:hypothetical protein
LVAAAVVSAAKAALNGFPDGTSSLTIVLISFTAGLLFSAKRRVVPREPV